MGEGQNAEKEIYHQVDLSKLGEAKVLVTLQKKLVADLSLGNAILKETVKGNFKARTNAGKPCKSPKKRFRFLSEGSVGRLDNLVRPNDK